MMGWLRTRLKRWLDGPEKDRAPDLRLQCRVPGGGGHVVRTYLIGGARGMLLEGLELEGGQEVRLLADWQAVDREQFWAIWRHFTPDWRGWRWESGGQVGR